MNIKFLKTNLKGLLLIKRSKYFDNRGYLTEILNKKNFFKNRINLNNTIITESRKNVLRGLHLQTKKPQAKFLTVIKGKIFDVIVDLRKNSKTFGKYFSITLSKQSYSSIYIPEGLAHGFCGLDRENIVYYGCSNYRKKKHEIGILWNDKDLKIKWPVKLPILSKKDSQNISFKDYCNIKNKI